MIDPVEKGSKKVELYGEFEGWKRKHEMGWIMFWLKGGRTAWKKEGRKGGKKKEKKVCFVVSVSSWLSSGYGMFVLREERTGERRKELIILIIELVAF